MWRLRRRSASWIAASEISVTGPGVGIRVSLFLGGVGVFGVGGAGLRGHAFGRGLERVLEELAAAHARFLVLVGLVAQRDRARTPRGRNLEAEAEALPIQAGTHEL